MKTAFLLLLFCIARVPFTQTVRFIDTYTKETGIFKSLTVPMLFDSDSITRKSAGSKAGPVYRIDYVASSYARSVSDYQERLDEKRWKKMYEFARILPDSSFETNIYYQTSATNEMDSKKLFHGFVIYYNEPARKSHTAALHSFPELMSALAGKPVTADTKILPVSKPIRLDSISIGNVTSADMKKIEAENTLENVIVEWVYDSVGINKIFYNTRYCLTKVTAGLFAMYNTLSDKSLIEMLRRISTDKNTLIVTDMTGSMYPYYSQLLVWHALRIEQKTINNYVFFNDGDMKPDADKKIGTTGGLYSTRSNQLLDVYNKMASCMTHGYGGDLPENNFEAVLHGLNTSDSVNKIVLICDNWAVPRDISLLSSIDQPIDFVMCGTSLGTNRTYINLAHLNKGKLHTIEKSITDLDRKVDGDIFSIGSRRYTIKKGAVVEYSGK